MAHSFKIVTSSLLSMTLSNITSNAQELDLELEDLGFTEITATRLSNDWINAPYTITTLNSEDWKNTLQRSLVESLAQVPGVTVQKTANGQGSPFLRGFTGYRTLALIDGVRYNNSVYRDGPNEYFSLIDLGAIERIEVLQGPASVTYGSDAIGGALNLLTKETSYLEEDGVYNKGKISYRYSSAENSHQQRAEFELGKGGDWGLRLGLSAKQFGDVDAADIGIQENTGYDELALDLRFDKQLSELWNLTAVHQSLSQDDVWRTHSTIFGESFAGTTVGTDLRRLKDQERSLTYLNLKGEEVSDWADSLSITLSYQTWNEDGDRIRSDGRRDLEFFDSAMLGFDLQVNKSFETVNLVYGVDVYHDQVDSGRTDFNPDGSIDEVRVQGPIGDDSKFTQAGIHLQAEWDLNEKIQLTGGTRFSHVRASVGSFEDPATGLADSFSDSWSTLVNSVRVKYALTENQDTNLWGGISQSFRAPNIADISRFGSSRSTEFEVAATDLDPEKFLTFETGIKAERENYTLSATYYHTLIDEFITSTPTGRIVDGLIEVSKRNSAEGFIQGIELSGEYHINDEWSVWGNFTWIEGELDIFDTTTSTEPIREPISRIMPATINAGIKWKRIDEKIWAGLNLQWADTADTLSSGDINDTQRIPPGGTPSYTKVDIYTGYKINETWETQLVLSNLLDEAYRVHGSGTNEPGFGIDLGITAKF